VIHPHIVELILFCLAVIASLFPQHSRRLVILPVAQTAHGALWWMRRDAKRQLETMDRVGDSAFNLVIYIAYYCTHEFLWVVWTSSAFFICINGLSYWKTGHISALPYSVLLYGGLIGRVVKLNSWLGSMLTREKTRKMLQKIVADESL